MFWYARFWNIFISNAPDMSFRTNTGTLIFNAKTTIMFFIINCNVLSKRRYFCLKYSHLIQLRRRRVDKCFVFIINKGTLHYNNTFSLSRIELLILKSHMDVTTQLQFSISHSDTVSLRELLSLVKLINLTPVTSFSSISVLQHYGPS
jgi:hypothetical protein